MSGWSAAGIKPTTSRMLRLRSTTELRRVGAIFGSGRERGRQRMGKVLAMVFHNEHSRHRILRCIIIAKFEYWVLEYRHLRPKRTNPLDRISETSKFQIPEDLNIRNQDFGSGSEFRISGSSWIRIWPSLHDTSRDRTENATNQR